MAPLDYPAACPVVRVFLDRTRFLSAASDMRGETELGGEVTHLAVVVALVEAESLRRAARRSWTGDDDALERLTRQLEVVAVCSGYDDGEGDAVGLRQQAAFGAALGPIGRIRARFFFPRAAPSSSRRPSRASPSPRRRIRRSRPGPTPTLVRTHPPRSTRRTSDVPMSWSRYPSPSARSTESRCEARTGSPSSHHDRPPAGCDTREDAASPAESTARSETRARLEYATHHHARPVPCPALHRSRSSWTELRAGHANLSARQTFMPHMELPAYRDRLLAGLGRG